MKLKEQIIEQEVEEIKQPPITEKNVISKKWTIILLIIIIISQVTVRLYFGNQKQYLHMDEAYSYGLMNYDKLEITDNEDFYNTWHTNKYFEDYLSITDKEVFNIERVYENQKNDVHPPLYYLLLRIAASFTINSFSMWTGIIINIIIFIISSIFVYLISKLILKNPIYALMTCLITGFTIISIESSLYIRMYELANLNILIITYLHIKNYNKKLNYKNLIPISIALIIGALTHYYYLIFAFILYIIYSVNFIKNKSYKDMIKYNICIIISAIISLIIFPYSISHLFFGYRGQGAFLNLFDTSEFILRIAQYLIVLDNNIFSNMLIPLLIVLIYLYFTKKPKLGTKNKEIILLLIPTLIYFILVSKVSPYIEIRYIIPIYSCTVILIVYYLKVFLNKCFNYKKSNIIFAIIFTIILIMPVIMNKQLDFTYTKYNNIANKVQNEYNYPILYIFNNHNNRFLDDLYLFTKSNDTYIIKSENANQENLKEILKQKELSKGMLLFLNEGMDNNKLISDIKNINNYTQSNHLQRLNAADIYYLH